MGGCGDVFEVWLVLRVELVFVLVERLFISCALVLFQFLVVFD